MCDSIGYVAATADGAIVDLAYVDASGEHVALAVAQATDYQSTGWRYLTAAEAREWLGNHAWQAARPHKE